MSRPSRMFGKYENTLFYADYGHQFLTILFVLALLIGIVYFWRFT